MNSKRLLQNVLVQSARYSAAAQRSILTVASSAAVRSTFALNRNALVSLPVRHSMFQQRQFNNKAEPSTFKVVDYNDIQKLIQNSDKVRASTTYIYTLTLSMTIGLQLD